MTKNYSPLKELLFGYGKVFILLIVFSIFFNYQSYAQVDLSITKSVDNATPNIGEQITFTLRVTNSSATDATGVSVQDILPDGYSNISNIGNGTNTGSTVNWVGLTIPANSFVDLTITATVLRNGNYNNRAQITASDQTDPDSNPALGFDQDDNGNGNLDDDDDESNTVIVTPATADLSITKTVNNSTPQVGEAITFTLTVTNAGPATATGVNVRDQLPSGYGGVTTISNGGATFGNLINWPSLTIPANTSINLTINTTVLPTGEYNNRAEITASNQNDPDSDPTVSFDTDDLADGNNDDDESDLVIVTPQIADLSLTKDVNNLTPNVGTQIEFTVTVSNSGTSNATGVEVTDILQAGYIYVSDNSGGNYNPTTGVWNVGTVTNGGSESITIVAVVTLEQAYTNTAEITASDVHDPDSTPNNNNPSEDDQATVSNVNPTGLLIPQVFSPNGDQYNETFRIPGLGYLYPNFKMEIFTRWGNKVFEYTNAGRTTPLWWDGFSNGNLTFNGSKKLPTGTYYYILYFNKDNRSPISNWVYLNR